MTGSDRIWPVGGYAPGLYMCKCSTCGKTHHADKRAWQCADCVIQRLRDPAVLAALPEVQALIAAAYEVAAQVVDTCNREGPYQAIGAACRVRSLTPADATAALAARDAAMRAQGLREAAEWYRVAGWKLDEDDVPDAILARAAGIEGDATNGG